MLTFEYLEKPKRIGWNKGLPQTWRKGHYTTTLEGKPHAKWIEEHGPTAVYHMKKYGHLDNIGKGPGAKKGNTNAKTRLIDGKSISEWAKELGVSRRRVTVWFERHGTMKGCVPGKAGGWNKGMKKLDA